MAKKSANKSYAQLSQELSKVLEDLEGGELDIDQAVSRYEQGLSIIKQLEIYLNEAENKVTTLKLDTSQHVAGEMQ